MRAPRTLWASIILLGLLLGACSMDRRAEVDAGEYAPAQTAARSTVERVRVDRVHRMAWFVHADGSYVIVPFSPRSPSEWPLGCPTNAGSTAMEVLELEAEALTVASTSFHRPVLVRNCPSNPEEVVLRSDGEIGGSGTACSGAEVCLVFEQAPSTTSLPPLMKGYELYSWIGTGEDAWTYALVTGTNRNKSYAELSAPENVVTGDGWVKITVQGTDALESMLGLLPEDETIAWLDTRQAEGAPALERAFPDPEIVQAIEQTCRQRGIHLMTLEADL